MPSWASRFGISADRVKSVALRLLITRKRSAQAVGSGVKERSSRTQDLTLAPLPDGAQRLEGRRIRQTPSRLGQSGSNLTFQSKGKGPDQERVVTE